jgi:hypothetical protein
MFVNVKKVEITFGEFVRFNIVGDEDTTTAYLNQKYDGRSVYIAGEYVKWQALTTSQKAALVEKEMGYGFSFVLARAEVEFALDDERLFTPYFADGYNLIRIFDDGIEYTRLEQVNTYTRTLLVMPWSKSLWSAVKTGLGEPLHDKPGTITVDEKMCAEWKTKFAPNVQVLWHGSPKYPQPCAPMERADFSEHVAHLTRWAEKYSDGNLVRVDFHPDPYETKLVSFNWAFSVFEDAEGQVPANRFGRGNSPVHGGLIYHEKSEQYSVHT